MHLVSHSKRRVETVEGAEILVEAHFLFERNMQATGDSLVQRNREATAKFGGERDVGLGCC